MTAFAAAQHQAAQTDDPAKIFENLLAIQKGFDDLAGSMQKDWATFDSTFGKSLTSQLADAGVFTTQMEANIQAINKSWIDSSTTVTTWGAKVGAVYAMLKTLKIDDVSLDEQQLAAMQRNLQTMEQMGAPLQQQLAVQAQISQLQIKIADSTGATAQQTLLWTEQLTAVQTQMNVLKDQTIGLSNLYTGMVKALGTAWTDLGKGLGDAMVSGQNFGAALTKVFDTLKQQIAELVSQYLLNQLKDAFLQNTDAVNSFAKVFNSIFGGGGQAGSVATSMQAFDQSMTDAMDHTVATVSSAGQSVAASATGMSSAMSQSSSSVVKSSQSMAQGLQTVAAVVGAIASIFSAIELMHTNTLLSDIEHETARMAIYLGDSGSGSIQFYTGKSAEFLGYIHGDIVTIMELTQSMNETLTNILAAVVAGGAGGGGSGGAALQSFADQIGADLKVLDGDLAGPYGLGASVQGVATAASATGTSLATLSTVTSTLGTTLTAVGTTVTAAANTVATSFTAITKATPVPATVAYSPGSNSFTPILPTANVPGIGNGGPGGSNSFTSNNILTNPGQLILNIQTNITPGVVAMNNNAQIQQFSDLVSKNVVTKLQQVGGQKIR